MRIERPLQTYVHDPSADPGGTPDWLGDIVALGGEVTAQSLLDAYASGIFPMDVSVGEDQDDECLCDECVAKPAVQVDAGGTDAVSGAQWELTIDVPTDQRDVTALGSSMLAWWSPLRRGVLPITALRVTRSLAQSCRRYHVTVNRDFDEVLHECADPRDNSIWMTEDFIAAYRQLHARGYAHSVETRDRDGRLVGGLICVEQGGLVNGDSMFHRERDASKVALVALVRMLRAASPAPALPPWLGGRLLDVQWVTPHLSSLGAVDIPRRDYVTWLPAALAASPAVAVYP